MRTREARKKPAKKGEESFNDGLLYISLIYGGESQFGVVVKRPG